MKKNKLTTIIASIVLIAALIVVGDYSGALDSAISMLDGQTSMSYDSDRQSSEADGTLEVHFIDVGQADAIVIVQGDNAMLVDAGESATGEKVVEYIASLGIKKLEYAVGTHPHSDHIGAMRMIINSFEIGKIFMPSVEHDTYTYEKTLTLIDEKGIKLTAPKPMDKIKLGEASITFLSPDPSTEFDDLNDYSITFILDYGEFSAMFTGDMGTKPENIILESGYDIDCDVLKIAHHGSKTASSEAFIDAVAPEYGVITAEPNADSNLPAKTIVERYESRGIRLYRTDINGNIVMRTDGENIEFETEKN